MAKICRNMRYSLRFLFYLPYLSAQLLWSRQEKRTSQLHLSWVCAMWCWWAQHFQSEQNTETETPGHGRGSNWVTCSPGKRRDLPSALTNRKAKCFLELCWYFGKDQCSSVWHLSLQFKRKIVGVSSFQLQVGKNVNGQMSMVHLAGHPYQGSLLFSMWQLQRSIWYPGALRSVHCTLWRKKVSNLLRTLNPQ